MRAKPFEACAAHLASYAAAFVHGGERSMFEAGHTVGISHWSNAKRRMGRHGRVSAGDVGEFRDDTVSGTEICIDVETAVYDECID